MQTRETNRLVLRAPRLSDASATQRLLPHWTVVKYLATVPWPYPDDGATTYLSETVLPGIANGTILAWVITVRELGDELAGFVDIHAHTDRPTWGSRGFWLGEEFWNAGYMTEALEAVNRHVFGELGIESFEARNAVANTASSRLKANGVARYIETIIDDCLCGPVPTEVWQVHRDDWLAAHP